MGAPLTGTSALTREASWDRGGLSSSEQSGGGGGGQAVLSECIILLAGEPGAPEDTACTESLGFPGWGLPGGRSENSVASQPWQRRTTCCPCALTWLPAPAGQGLSEAAVATAHSQALGQRLLGPTLSKLDAWLVLFHCYFEKFQKVFLKFI